MSSSLFLFLLLIFIIIIILGLFILYLYLNSNNNSSIISKDNSLSLPDFDKSEDLDDLDYDIETFNWSIPTEVIDNKDKYIRSSDCIVDSDPELSGLQEGYRLVPLVCKNNKGQIVNNNKCNKLNKLNSCYSGIVDPSWIDNKQYPTNFNNILCENEIIKTPHYTQLCRLDNLTNLTDLPDKFKVLLNKKFILCVPDHGYVQCLAGRLVIVPFDEVDKNKISIFELGIRSIDSDFIMVVLFDIVNNSWIVVPFSQPFTLFCEDSKITLSKDAAKIQIIIKNYNPLIVSLKFRTQDILIPVANDYDNLIDLNQVFIQFV